MEHGGNSGGPAYKWQKARLRLTDTEVAAGMPDVVWVRLGPPRHRRVREILSGRTYIRVVYKVKNEAWMYDLGIRNLTVLASQTELLPEFS